MLRLLPLAAALALAVPARADDKPKDKPKTFEVESFLNIPYYDGPDAHKVKHKLDLYLPKGAGDFPVLFFVHGGAWSFGDKDWLYGYLGACYARQGVGVVVTNYRLSPAVKHPEHIKDVARAFAWTCKNIAKYGGDPERLFACGHSAGAHLVALLAADETYLKDEGIKASRIRGVIPISGVFNIPNGVMVEVFGRDGKAASPIRHVHEGMPPFLLLCADGDFPTCGRKAAEPFLKALSDKSARAELVEIKNSDHMKIIFSAADAGSPVVKAILGFIEANGGKP
jgi:acetyl esterase/lipase